MTRLPPRRILVPTDLSRVSRSALRTAERLAERFGAKVEVACLEGEPGSGIPRFARASRADLIVMGTHGRRGLDRVVLGSVAEGVIRRSRVPVLAVPEGRAPRRISRILAPCNMRNYADEALRAAVRTAAALGARVVVLYVAPPDSDRSAARTKLRRHLDSLLGRRAASKLGVRVRLGEPRTEIAREARSGKYGLVALSAHRKPLFSDYVLGSTVERLLGRSPAAILSIPSSKGRGAVHSYSEWGA